MQYCTLFARVNGSIAKHSAANSEPITAAGCLLRIFCTCETAVCGTPASSTNSNFIGWDYTCGGGTFHYSAVATTVRIGASAGMPPHTCSQVPPGQGPKAISALFDATTFTVSASGATLTVTSPAQTLTFHKDGAARLYWANN